MKAFMEKTEFIITADQRLNEKELDLDVFNFPIAIFSFFKTMAEIETWEKQVSRFDAKRINHPKSDDSRLHWGKIIQWPMSIWNIENFGIPIVFVGPVLSGPWCAMALEELKVLGLKYAIGIGSVSKEDDFTTPTSGTFTIHSSTSEIASPSSPHQRCARKERRTTSASACLPVHPTPPTFGCLQSRLPEQVLHRQEPHKMQRCCTVPSELGPLVLLCPVGGAASSLFVPVLWG